MCKVHFHPFAVIISPFPCSGYAMGVKIYFFFILRGASHPSTIQQGASTPLKCTGENTDMVWSTWNQVHLKEN
jgi:hypothetical protein